MYILKIQSFLLFLNKPDKIKINIYIPNVCQNVNIGALTQNNGASQFHRNININGTIAILKHTMIKIIVQKVIFYYFNYSSLVSHPIFLHTRLYPEYLK